MATNEELIAEARKWPRELEGNLINDLADALAAVPATTDDDEWDALFEAIKSVQLVDLNSIHLIETAIFAAGFHRTSVPAPKTQDGEACTVTTVEELDALPVGSIVRNWKDERTDYEDGTWSQGAVAEKRPDLAGQPAWFLVGSTLGYRSHQADILPATVLYVPVSPDGDEGAKG